MVSKTEAWELTVSTQEALVSPGHEQEAPRSFWRETFPLHVLKNLPDFLRSNGTLQQYLSVIKLRRIY